MSFHSKVFYLSFKDHSIKSKQNELISWYSMTEKFNVKTI